MTNGFVACLAGIFIAFISACCFAQDAAPRDCPEFKQYFDAAGVNGTIVIYDLHSHSSLVYNRPCAETAFLPASTFKVINSLIGLETGVVRDPDNQIFKWDGVTRDVKAWNQDQTLRTAIKYSVVPVYQQIARQIGPERMQHYLQAVGYGNYDIGGTPIDEFWLHGNLRITAEEQVQFLKRLHEGDLPFSKRSMDIVKDITVIEKTPAYTLHAKTGWAAQVTPQIGWLVGWVDRADNAYIFATNIEVQNAQQLPARLGITKAIMQKLGIL